MIVIKFVGAMWLAQLVLTVLVLAQYGLGHLVRVVSERLAARKIVAVEELI